MEKNEILNKLKALEASLPNDGIETQKKTELVSRTWNAFSSYNKRLRDDSVGIYEYDKDEMARIDMEQESLYSALSELTSSSERIRSYLTQDELDIVEYERLLKDELPTQISKYEKTIGSYDEWLKDKNLPQEARKSIKAGRDEYVSRLEAIKDKENFYKKKIAERKEEVKEWNELLSDQEASITKKRSLYEANDKKLEEIRTASKLTPEQVAQAEYEANLLYTRYLYLARDPKKVIAGIISDFEQGKLTEKELALRVSDLNSTLSSGLYDLSGVTTLVASDAVLAYRRELNSKIAALEERISNKDNYKKINKNIESNIWGYNTILGNLEPGKTELENKISNKREAVRKNKEALEKLQNTKNPGATEAERLEAALSLDSQVDVIKAEIKSDNELIDGYKADIAKIEEKKDKYKGMITELNKELYSLDTDARSKDFRLLEEQRALLETTFSEESLGRTAFLGELDGFTKTLTGGVKLRGEDNITPFLRTLSPEQREAAAELYSSIPPFVSPAVVGTDPYIPYTHPTFWDELSQKQKDIYEDYIKDLTPEELADLNQEIEDEMAVMKAEANTEPLALPEGRGPSPLVGDEQLPFDLEKNGPEYHGGVQAGNTPPTPPEPPKPKPKKVKKFKDMNSREKLEAAKKFFKNNWKKIVAAAIVIGFVIGVGGLTKCASDVNAKEPVTVVQLVKDAAADVGGVIKPTDDHKTPTDPGKPTDPGNPTDPGTDPEEQEPVYDNDVNDDGIVDTTYSRIDPTITTGDSKPADPEAAYIDGEGATYDPETGTYIDHDGTKITDQGDGTFLVETDAQEYTVVDENVNSVTNPDLTPVQEAAPLVEEPAVTVEQALQQGTIDNGTANNAQGTFDELFNAASEEQSQSLGGR